MKKSIRGKYIPKPNKEEVKYQSEIIINEELKEEKKVYPTDNMTLPIPSLNSMFPHFLHLNPNSSKIMSFEEDKSLDDRNQIDNPRSNQYSRRNSQNDLVSIPINHSQIEINSNYPRSPFGLSNASTHKNWNIYNGYQNNQMSEQIQLNSFPNQNPECHPSPTYYMEGSTIANGNYGLDSSRITSNIPNNFPRIPTPVPDIMPNIPNYMQENTNTSRYRRAPTTRLRGDFERYSEVSENSNAFPHIPIIRSNSISSEESKFGLPPSFVGNQGNFSQFNYQPNNQNAFNRSIQVEELKDKTSLEKFFSYSASIKNIKQSSLKYFRIYESAKKSINIEQSSSSIQPLNMHTPYSESYISKIGNISFVKDLGSTDKKAESQIFLYKNETNNNEYVMKRYVYYFYPEEKDLKELEGLENFIRNQYIEYSLMKFYSTCPYSVSPIFFNIIQIKKVEVIVTEMIMEYAGETIMDTFPITVSQLAYEYLYQLTCAIHFLQEFQILNNGIYPSNIMVRTIENKSIISIINFNIGAKLSNFKESNFTCIKKDNSFYWAPELFNPGNASKFEDSNFSIWNIQIYSMAVILLQLISFFNKANVKYENFNNYKMSEENYKQFLEKIDLYCVSEVDKFMKNIILVIRPCLSYSPEMRLSPNEFIPLINNLETKTKKAILDEIDAAYDNRKKLNSNNYIKHTISEKEVMILNDNLHKEDQSSINSYNESSLEKSNQNLLLSEAKNNIKLEDELILQRESNILLLKENANLNRDMKESYELNEKRDKEILEMMEDLAKLRKKKEILNSQLQDELNKIPSLKLTIERKKMENNDLMNNLTNKTSQNLLNLKNIEKIDENLNTCQENNIQINSLETINILNYLNKVPEDHTFDNKLIEPQNKNDGHIISQNESMEEKEEEMNLNISKQINWLNGEINE